jgi:hypothetical protein
MAPKHPYVDVLNRKQKRQVDILIVLWALSAGAHALADHLRRAQPARTRNARRNGLRLLRNRSPAPKPYYVMKLILAALAALSMGAYLYCEEAQTAEPAAATGQISKASPQPDLGSTVDYLTAKYGKPSRRHGAEEPNTVFDRRR